MKKLIILLSLTLFIFTTTTISAQNISLLSPDENINIKVYTDEIITWSVFYKGKEVIQPTEISMTVNDKELGVEPSLLEQEENKIDDIITSPVPNKDAKIHDLCNELKLIFEGDFSISFRAYNDGVAYKFDTYIKEELTVNSEKLELAFPKNSQIFFTVNKPDYRGHYEGVYKLKTIDTIPKGKMTHLPVLVKTAEDNINVLITETDVFDYPHFFLKGTRSNVLTAGLPPVILDYEIVGKGFGQWTKEEADYIAKTNGDRSYPWRVFIITEEDKDIVESNLAFQLSSPCAIKNTDWIKPGKAAWDWWNALNIYGVDFESGINTATFKYYIDFASKYGLEYLMIDEGWSVSTTEIKEHSDAVNVPELVKYAAEKNVDILLWVLWGPLDDDLEEILDIYQKWGVKGIKVDFMQRADQGMVNYYERVAKACADRELLVDYHGAYKPAGLRSKYPNVISYEGVYGNENFKLDGKELFTAEQIVNTAYIRMSAGPLDFTPGAMDNVTSDMFCTRYSQPVTSGTRCNQIAMFVVYESPIQMLCDNPTNYLRNDECTKFISRIPTVWDETIVLDGKVSDFIIIARKKDDVWYLGALNDENPRDLEIDLSFLSKGKHSAEILKDGINAHRNAKDYKKDVLDVDNTSKIKIHMAPGGGWAAIIK